MLIWWQDMTAVLNGAQGDMSCEDGIIMETVIAGMVQYS